jgi:hypothetical protein
MRLAKNVPMFGGVALARIVLGVYSLLFFRTYPLRRPVDNRHFTYRRLSRDFECNGLLATLTDVTWGTSQSVTLTIAP